MQIRIVPPTKYWQLDKKSTESPMHSFITSRRDINNCLLLGLPDYLIHKPQVLQHADAHLIMKLSSHYHITEALKDLHWLPMGQQIKFKTIMFKTLHDIASENLKLLLTKKHNAIQSLHCND